MVDSPLGPIPEGWEMTSVRDVATVIRGRSYRGSELVAEGGMPFLNLKCIDRGGGFRPDGVKRYVGAYRESQKVGEGDVVMAVTDMTQERRIVAHAARVPRGYGDSVFSMDLVKIRPGAEVPGPYLYGMLRFSEFADEVKQHANGANVLHLNPERIGDFKFPLPTAELRSVYSDFAEAVLSQSDVLHEPPRV